MIFAHQAKALAENSQLEVDKVLQVLEPLIREAASKGERSLNYAQGRFSWREDNYTAQKSNEKFVEQVISTLKKYGFACGLAHSEPYKVGLDEDEHRSVYLLIRW